MALESRNDALLQYIADLRRQNYLRSNRTAGEYAQDFGLSLLSGAIDLGQAAYGAENMATLGALDAVAGLSANFQEAQDVIAGLHTDKYQYQKNKVDAAFEEGILPGVGELVTTPPVLLGEITRMIPGLLPAAGVASRASTVVRAAGGTAADVARVANPAVLAAVGAQSAGASNIDAVNRSREEGGDSVEQALSGLEAGAIAAILSPLASKVTGAGRLEAALASRAAGGGATGAVTGGVVRGVAAETTEEALQSAGEQLAQNAPFATDIDSLFEGTGEASARGAVLAALPGAAFGAATPRTPSRNNPKLRESIATNIRDVQIGLSDTGLTPPTSRGFSEGAPEFDLEPSGAAFGGDLPPEVQADLRNKADSEGRPVTDVIAEYMDQQAAAENAVADSVVASSGPDLFSAENIAAQQVANNTYGRETPVSDVIAQLTGIDGGNAITERDLAKSPKAVRAKIRTAQTDKVLNSEFRRVNVDGQDYYVRFNRDLQRLEEFTRPEAEAAVAGIVDGRVDEVLAAIEKIQTERYETAPSTAPADIQQSIYRSRAADARRTYLGVDATVREVQASRKAQRPLSKAEARKQTIQSMVLQEAAKDYTVVRTGDTLEGAEFYRYDRDIQSMVRVSQEELDAKYRDEVASEVDGYYDEIVQQEAADKEALAAKSMPIGKVWRSYFAAKFGVKPQAMTGPEWKAFVSEAEKVNVRPSTPTGEVFLASMADKLGIDPAGSSKFGVRLHAMFGSALPEALAAKENTAKDIWQAEVTAFQRFVSGFEGSADQAAAAYLGGAQGESSIVGRYAIMRESDSWEAMTEEQRAEVTDTYSRLMRDERSGLFYRNDTAGGSDFRALPIDQFTSLIENANTLRRGKRPIKSFQTVVEYRDSTGNEAPDSAAGVFTRGGDIYLINENVDSAADFAKVLMHERSHEGVAGVLGNNRTAALRRLQANQKLRKRIAAKQQQHGLSRTDAAEEVLVDMITDGTPLGRGVLNKFRVSLQGIVDKLIGVDKLVVSDSDVDDMMQTIRKTLTGRVYDYTPVLARGDSWQVLDDMLGNTDADVTTSDMFSLAREALREQAGSSPTGTTMNVQSAIRRAAEASGDMLRNARASTTQKGVFRAMLSAMPVNQMANVFGDRLPGLREFAANKTAKEAETNKQITREVIGEYGGVKVKISPLDLSRSWETFSHKEPKKFETLEQMTQNATMFSVFPEKSWDEQSDIDYENAPYTAAERREAYDRIRGQWQEIGGTGRQIFAQAQVIYDAKWKARFAAIISEREKALGIPHRILNEKGEMVVNPKFEDVTNIVPLMMTAMNKIKAGPYSPLQRLGDYLVIIRDRKDNIVYFSGHDTVTDQQRTAEGLQSRYPTNEGYSHTSTTRDEFQYNVDSVRPQTIENLRSAAKAATELTNDPEASAKQLGDILVETYMQALPDHSFMKHTLERKGVAGYSMKAHKAYNDYVIKAARNIAGLKYDGDMSRDLLRMQRAVDDLGRTSGADVGKKVNTNQLQQVINGVKSQHAKSVSTDSSPTADALSGGAFLWFMASPSQLFVNAMQTPLVAWPNVAARYGGSVTTKHFLKAMKLHAKSGFDMVDGKRASQVIDPEVAKVMGRLKEAGTLDFTQAQELSAIANAETAIGGSRVNNRWRQVVQFGTSFMHRSEVFNRQVTAHAAIELEIDRMKKAGELKGTMTDTQVEAVTELARRAVVDTHFDYTRSNAPEVLQGPWRRVFFQFQQYRLNMLAMQGKLIYDTFKGDKETRKTAMRTLGFMTAAQLGLTGAAGTVLAPIVFALMDAWESVDGEDEDDLTDSRTRVLQSMPSMVSYGALSGLIDTSRVETGSILPFFGDRAYAPRDATTQDSINYWLQRLSGPAAGAVMNVFNGAEMIGQGRVAEGVSRAAPVGLGALAKAYGQTANGLRDSELVSYYDPSIWDVTLTGLGLKSGALRDVADKRSAVYQAQKHASVMSRRLLTRMAIGYATDDDELVRDISARIQEWNRVHPEFVIKSGDIRRAIRSRARSQQNADEYGVPLYSTPGPQVQRIIDRSE